VWSAEFDRMDDAFWYEKQIQGWGVRSGWR